MQSPLGPYTQVTGLPHSHSKQHTGLFSVCSGHPCSPHLSLPEMCILANSQQDA